MSVREFTAADGSPWQVWAVYPPSLERRAGADRRVSAASDPWSERRLVADRRVHDRGRPAAIAGPLAEGWLCFESATSGDPSARKRLAPIPSDWEHCSQGDLRVHLEHAAPAVRRNTSA